MKFLFEDGDQNVRGHGSPDLRPFSVLAGGQKSLDAQVLFDPLETQLDLPTALVQSGDAQWWQSHVVGKKTSVFPDSTSLYFTRCKCSG